MPTMPSVLPGQQKRILVGALVIKNFSGVSHLRVAGMDATRATNRHAQCHFGDRLRENRACCHHMNAAPKTFFVIDVGQEIRFNIRNDSQVRRAVEACLVECALSNKRDSVRQCSSINSSVAGCAIIPHDMSQLLQTRPVVMRKSLIDRAWIRVEQNGVSMGISYFLFYLV
jgi:hypothetical protein